MLLQGTAVDQIIDICTTLRYLGVPHQGQELHVWRTINQFVTSSTIPQLHHLQKTPFDILSSSQGSNCSQNSISFHWKDGKSKPSWTSSAKHWEFCNCVAPCSGPILFLEGARLPPQLKGSGQKFRQPLQVQSHLEIAKDSGSARSHSNAPGKLAPQPDPKMVPPTRRSTRYQDQNFR